MSIGKRRVAVVKLIYLVGSPQGVFMLQACNGDVDMPGPQISKAAPGAL
jgi:hypothetical protein